MGPSIVVEEQAAHGLMQLELIRTGDGSASLRVAEWDETFHSRRGAIRESRHVYLEHGIRKLTKSRPDQAAFRVLEMGFGTGLNTLLAALNAVAENRFNWEYVSIDNHPIDRTLAMALDFPVSLDQKEAADLFDKIHAAPWNKSVQLFPGFELHKLQIDLQVLDIEGGFDLLLYDAFGPRVQPHFWTAENFTKLKSLLKPGGFLVTYCAKGIVKRALRAAGFTVETLAGPPGKREMVRAWA